MPKWERDLRRPGGPSPQGSFWSTGLAMNSTSAGKLTRVDFRAMNSDVELFCVGENSSLRLDRVQAWLRAFEARFSRFRQFSELSRLNRSGGKPFRASPALFRLVEISVDFARRSGGVFDPTLLTNLEDAGYDRSFELIEPRRQPALHAGCSGAWRAVSLDPVRRLITLPRGVRIDLGGFAKGWAVDRMAALLGQPSLVNGGGDVFASGRPPDAPHWLVGVEDPFEPSRDLAVLSAEDRGIATSSVLRRRWRTGDAWAHHLIDPRTGCPSQAGAVQVTVIAASCLLADLHAKVALLLGAETGLEYLNHEAGVEGLIVRDDGSQVASRDLGGYLIR
jgi:thiamine biosynthesis lipoprotein